MGCSRRDTDVSASLINPRLFGDCEQRNLLANEPLCSCRRRDVDCVEVNVKISVPCAPKIASLDEVGLNPTSLATESNNDIAD